MNPERTGIADFQELAGATWLAVAPVSAEAIVRSDRFDLGGFAGPLG